MQEYTGPIERGMRFLWEPMLPHATQHCIVIDRKINSDDEMWITTRAWVATSKVSGDYTGETCYNDEGRFREAVVLVVDPPEDQDEYDEKIESLLAKHRKILTEYYRGL
jgi:hypothetical protein